MPKPSPAPASPAPSLAQPSPPEASFLAPSQAQPSSAQASPAHHAGQVSPAQAQLTNRKPSPARPAQVRPGQATTEPSPAQAVGVGLATKAFSYRIQIKPSLAQPRPAQPTTQARSAQPKPSSQTASPVQPGPRPQPSPAQPKPWCGPCQSSAKGFFLPDSEVPFSAAGALSFCSVFGRFGAAVPLRFAVLRGRLWGLVFGASPAQASEPSPAQPSPAQALVWALPKLCQSLFLPDSDVAF